MAELKKHWHKLMTFFTKISNIASLFKTDVHDYTKRVRDEIFEAYNLGNNEKRNRMYYAKVALKKVSIIMTQAFFLERVVSINHYITEKYVMSQTSTLGKLVVIQPGQRDAIKDQLNVQSKEIMTNVRHLTYIILNFDYVLIRYYMRAWRIR